MDYRLTLTDELIAQFHYHINKEPYRKLRHKDIAKCAGIKSPALSIMLSGEVPLSNAVLIALAEKLPEYYETVLAPALEALQAKP